MSKETVTVGCGLHNRFDIETRTLPAWYRLLPRSWWANIRKTIDFVLNFLGWHPALLWGYISEVGVAENIVLNQGITKFINYLGATEPGSQNNGFAANNWNSTIELGSGTTTPAATQTALVTPVFSLTPAPLNTQTVGGTMSAQNTTISQAIVGVIDAGQRIGDVYREIGLKGGGSLNTRALILDGQGQPLTITKADLQVLTITATSYVVFSQAYGGNFAFIGGNDSTTSGIWTSNGMLRALFSAYGYAYHYNDPSLQIGTSTVTPVWNETPISAQAVRTKLTTNPATMSMTRTIDLPNKKVTYSYRIPSTVAGTITEIGCVIGNSPWWRLVLPCANYAGTSIVKNSTNVVDVSFVLQF